MSVRFYNTMTNKKEEFVPLEEGKVGMYVCGITAYDMCHIGHARSAVVFDVIFKYFKYRGYNVTYVKNFTDVDDKIIAKANEEGTDISEISERYIKEHNEDMDRFGIARPTMTPKATENIQGMIRLISTLIEKGLAYDVDGDVYFSVGKFKQYGKLSGRHIEEMVAGARIEVDEKKTNPLDFILWKSAKEGEPWWDSPWGRGRPGWHIECSVMSQRFLGTTFDIHGGGRDLIFPHHENEIAQAEGASGEIFARYWIHNGFIRVNQEKMSKSLGNIFNMREAMNQYHPEVLRLFMMHSHYRSPVDFSDESLAEARLGMERFYGTLRNIKQYLATDIDFSALSSKSLTGNDEAIFEKVTTLPERFTEAMDDDFNTARALGYIFDVVRLINGYCSDKKFRPTPEALYVLNAAMTAIREVGKVLGLFLEDPDDYFEQDKKREAAKFGLNIDEIERLIEERQKARAAGNWKKADEIRDHLVSKKITLKDTPETTTWTIG
ncbi:MAG: cysteine--tRNA ligase [Deltaproteobacteria bacterium]|nr:cysteine--tRNA ligase [Deltaproteobacteria bacterium]MBN2686603.1 cysteine--tRNA ligase [Deltaproteobacteria bacterium]